MKIIHNVTSQDEKSFSLSCLEGSLSKPVWMKPKTITKSGSHKQQLNEKINVRGKQSTRRQVTKAFTQSRTDTKSQQLIEATLLPLSLKKAKSEQSQLPLEVENKSDSGLVD